MEQAESAWLTVQLARRPRRVPASIARELNGVRESQPASVVVCAPEFLPPQVSVLVWPVFSFSREDAWLVWVCDAV